ncbi:IS66 family insertion sequence element accessory protein TnpB [Paenibacillus sp. A3]|uniref:IS66 family insertion sequence element accessory protein TnpB n=1 Tax=Paenibacillus sp. A3 TaxID=1337054 RepID=UPI0009EA6142
MNEKTTVNNRGNLHSVHFPRCCSCFANRRREKLKILHWDHAGFRLYYRRLERGTFQWPAGGSAPLCLTPREL